MKKNDLENGMTVELRHGGKYIVCDGMIRSPNGSISLSAYTDTMCSRFVSADDICKVYDKADVLARDTKCQTVLWDREELTPVDYGGVLKNAVKSYGEDSQIDMAIEEMSELIKALLKYRRAYKKGTKTSDFDYETILSNVAEETADVLITLDQLGIIFGNVDEVAKYRREKILRLHDRLELKSCGT